MWIQTIRKCIGLGVLVALGGSLSWAKPVPVIGTAVSVSVYDDAGVGLETMERAEEVASYVFFRAGIEVRWRNCSVDGELTHAESCVKATFPTDLQLRLIRKSRNLKPGTVGIAYLSVQGTGCYSEVFVEPVEGLHKTLAVSTANVLGQAAAHELAHLLLGTNSHSPTGIMRAHWRHEDLVTADKGLLLFDDTQAETMRKRLALGASKNAQGDLIAAQLGGGGER